MPSTRKCDVDRKRFIASICAVLAAPFVAWRESRSRSYEETVLSDSPFLYDPLDYEMSIAYEMVGRKQEGGVTIIQPGGLHYVRLVPKRPQPSRSRAYTIWRSNAS